MIECIINSLFILFCAFRSAPISTRFSLVRLQYSLPYTSNVIKIFFESNLLCDIAARTVLLYVLLCLTYMYCTLYILYILHSVHIVHVSLFPYFPCLTDVEASSSTSVHSCSRFILIHIHKCTFT